MSLTTFYSDVNYWILSVMSLLPALASLTTIEWNEFIMSILASIILIVDSFQVTKINEEIYEPNLVELLSDLEDKVSSLIFAIVAAIASLFTGNYRTLSISIIGLLFLILSLTPLIAGDMNELLTIYTIKSGLQIIALATIATSIIKVPFQFAQRTYKFFNIPIVHLCRDFDCKISFDPPDIVRTRRKKDSN